MAPFVSSKGGASQFRLRESCVVPKTTGGEGGAEGAAGWIIYIYILVKSLKVQQNAVF